MIYCSSCGAAVKDGETFCGQCGAKVAQVPPSAPPSAGYYGPNVGYAAPYRRSSGGGVATASLVMGIIALVYSFIACLPMIGCYCVWLDPLLAVIAIVLGIIGLSDESAKGRATTGIILGIVSGIVTVALVVLGAVMQFGWIVFSDPTIIFGN